MIDELHKRADDDIADVVLDVLAKHKAKREADEVAQKKRQKTPKPLDNKGT